MKLTLFNSCYMHSQSNCPKPEESYPTPVTNSCFSPIAVVNPLLYCLFPISLRTLLLWIKKLTSKVKVLSGILFVSSISFVFVFVLVRETTSASNFLRRCYMSIPFLGSLVLRVRHNLVSFKMPSKNYPLCKFLTYFWN